MARASWTQKPILRPYFPLAFTSRVCKTKPLETLSSLTEDFEMVVVRVFPLNGEPCAPQHALPDQAMVVQGLDHGVLESRCRQGQKQQE